MIYSSLFLLLVTGPSFSYKASLLLRHYLACEGSVFSLFPSDEVKLSYFYFIFESACFALEYITGWYYFYFQPWQKQQFIPRGQPASSIPFMFSFFFQSGHSSGS